MTEISDGNFIFFIFKYKKYLVPNLTFLTHFLKNYDIKQVKTLHCPATDWYFNWNRMYWQGWGSEQEINLYIGGYWKQRVEILPPLYFPKKKLKNSNRTFRKWEYFLKTAYLRGWGRDGIDPTPTFLQFYAILDCGSKETYKSTCSQRWGGVWRGRLIRARKHIRLYVAWGVVG